MRHIVSILLVLWLAVGAIAANQRGYFDNSHTTCAKAGTDAVTIDVRLEGATATLIVHAPRGQETVRVPIRVARAESGIVRVEGDCALSLRALGVGPVRGPAGAFRLSDRVEVHFEAELDPIPG